MVCFGWNGHDGELERNAGITSEMLQNTAEMPTCRYTPNGNRGRINVQLLGIFTNLDKLVRNVPTHPTPTALTQSKADHASFIF